VASHHFAKPLLRVVLLLNNKVGIITLEDLMAKKTPKETRPLKNLDLSGDWDKHAETVRPAIKELDRRQAESIAKAPFIVVTNATK